MLIPVDPLKPASSQRGLMNRWHPDIPAFCTVKPGEVFKLGCHEWTGGQIKVRIKPIRSSLPHPQLKLLFDSQNSDDADDVASVDLTQIHYLTGPVAVEGAEPGDALVVDLLDITYYEEMPWGYTGASDDFSATLDDS